MTRSRRQSGRRASAALVLLLVALLALPAATRAQEALWLRQFGSPGHDAATSAAVDKAGGLYVVGWTSEAFPREAFAGGPRDAFVRKYAPDGTEAWTRQFGGPASDAITGVAVDEAGTVYVAGHSSGGRAPASPDIRALGFVRTFGSGGTLGAVRQFASAGYAIATQVAVGAPGNVYAVGWTRGALGGLIPIGPTDAFVAKVRP